MNKRITFTVVMLLLTASTGLASPTNGLVAYYPFDGDANDLSGNANHAVVYGALPTENRLAISDLSASASNLSRDGTLDGGFSIYLGVGNVNGQGKVIQLDGAGKRRGMVELPSTPYGLAYDSVQLWAALPSAKRVVSIDAQGRVNTILEAEELKAPISVAIVPGNRDILVADNHTDVLVLLSRNHANEYKVIYQGETSSNLQNMSVAMTLDGFGLMGTSNPRGVYHFPLRVGISLGAPILSSGGYVAADPTSTRWAVIQRRSLHVLDGTQEVFQLPLPAGYSSYRSGLLTFAPDGKLVVALATDGGVELCVIDISEKTFRSLFRWSGERLVSLAIGQKLDWPIAQQMKPARVELPKEKPVTSGTSTIDTAKAIVSRSAVDLKASQSTGLPESNLARITEGITVTASSYGSYRGHVCHPSEAIDGIISGTHLLTKSGENWWAPTSLPAWIELEFAEEHRIYELIIYFSQHTLTIDIEASLNGTDWFEIVPSTEVNPKRPDQPPASSYSRHRFNIVPSAHIQHLRVNVTASDAPRGHIYKADIDEIIVIGNCVLPMAKATEVISKTTRFDIPEENLKIPEEMQACTENLQKIYTAIKKYEKDKGKLPDWLSDLIPDYLISETLFCPKDARHKSPYSPDPKLPCSYGWQFSAKPIPQGWDPTGRTLYRDWKIQQVKLFGDVVPMVRCYHHSSKRILNLSAGGEIWWGPLDWEYMFKPDYDSIHKQMLSRAIASRPAVPAPSRSAPKQSSPLVGKPAPSFTLKDLEGKQVSLSDFKGKVVLLDFWATWCGPCLQAIPHMELLHKKYKDQGLVVIGINHERDHDKVKKFAENQISYVVLLDADEQFQQYGIRGIPTAFYIDREGKIRYREIGFTPGREKDVEQKIKELLVIKENMAVAPESKVNNGGIPVRIPLEHTTEMSKYGVSYYRPRGIQLSTNEPPQNWLLPQIDSATQRRFWAKKIFGSNTVMNVVIHTPHDPKVGAWDIFTTFDEDVDFSPVIPISIGVRSRKEMEFNIDYRNEAKQPYVLRVGPNTLNPGRYSLTYYRACIRTGIADILGREHKIVLSDDDSDGLYSDLADTMVLVSQDADGHMSRSDRIQADCPIEIGQSGYFTIEISDDGSSALLRPASYGLVEGHVACSSTQVPVAGATVRIMPHDFETTTDEKGRYRLRLPVGAYTSAQITASDYIPAQLGRHQIPSISSAYSARLDVELDPAVIPKPGELTLSSSESYHFLSGQRYSRPVGGDFYYSVSRGEPKFLANNRHQGGLVDLGQIQTPLDAVTPPLRGYSRFGVLAEVGHVYVSPAKQGEDDCHIVFRVTEIKKDDSCTLKYYYRQGETIK